jgi:hypothetical protein
MRWSPIVLVLAAIALSGCRNSCQVICVRMAKVAEEDCGITVPDDQLTACIESQQSIESKEDRTTCREYGGTDDIRSEWTCDQLSAYWGGGGGGGAAGDAESGTTQTP